MIGNSSRLRELWSAGNGRRADKEGGYPTADAARADVYYGMSGLKFQQPVGARSMESAVSSS